MIELKKYYELKSIDCTKTTLSSYKNTLDRFILYFNINNIEDVKCISSDDIQQYMYCLADNKNAKNKDTAKNSANAHFRIIKAFYNWLIIQEHLEESPCKNIKQFKVIKKIKIYLKESEITSILSNCKTIRDKLVIMLLLYTGIRVGEVAKIKISDIDENHLLIHGKGRKERKVILIPHIVKLLGEYLASRSDDNEYLFVSRKNFGVGARELHNISTQAIRDIVKKIAQKSDIDENRVNEIVPHTFRRTFAVNLTQNYKASTFQLQKAMGHSSVQTTQIYLEGAGAEISDDVMLEQVVPEGV